MKQRPSKEFLQIKISSANCAIQRPQSFSEMSSEQNRRAGHHSETDFSAIVCARVSARQINRGQECASAWIEPIAQGVSQQVERENRSHDSERRKYHQVRRVKQVIAGVVEHRAPTGC